MIGRPMVVRRRPMLRAAAVGGTFAAGRAMGRRSEEQANASAQAAAPQGAPQSQGPQAATAADAGQGASGGGSSVLDQLGQLTAMHEQGALTDDEFATAKAKVLGG
jgi:hypothetical protein